MTKLYRFGPSRQAILKGFVAGDDAARIAERLCAAGSRAQALASAQGLSLRTEKRSPGALWVDTGLRWLHTAAARASTLRATEDVVSALMDEAKAAGALLLPNAVRPALPGGWKPFLCGDTHQVERPLEQLVTELSQDGSLLGRLLLARGAVASGDLWIDVAGGTFRVRPLRPAPAAGEWIYETGPQTRFSLFSPALRTSVDVVILADCSGSMAWEDIADAADATPEPPVAPVVPAAPKRSLLRSLFGLGGPREEPPPAINTLKTIKRIEALKRALDNLLAVRLRTPGRVSRIALVAFTESCQARFPRGGGMIEMDENAPPELVQQFQDAIALLQPEKAGTNIGTALNHAAELLDKHGRPGNDRLIVLISDGADWKPKNSDDAGELVRGVDEPVSLMEDLHQRMRISLHALGISNEDIFWSWWRRNHGQETAALNHLRNWCSHHWRAWGREAAEGVCALAGAGAGDPPGVHGPPGARGRRRDGLGDAPTGGAAAAARCPGGRGGRVQIRFQFGSRAAARGARGRDDLRRLAPGTESA